MKKAKIKKLRPKLGETQLPKITHRDSDPDKSFPVEHLSYSGMTKFSSNPLLFRIQYINGDRIDTAHSAASVLGNAFHFAIDLFFQTEDADPVAAGLRGGINFIEEYNEGFINWTATIPDRQKMIEKFSLAYGQRIAGLSKDAKFIASEQMIEEHVDVEWRGKKVSLPVKLKGYLDRLYDEDGLVIEDDKICASFSNPDKIDGRKILQAVVYYFLVYAKYGKAPKKMRFVETKHTKSKDGQQIRIYEIIYAENEYFFDFFLRFYGDIVDALMGKQVYVPNIDTFMDNEVGIISYIHRLDLPDEVAKESKRLKVDSITEILKKKLASVRNMNSLQKAVEKSLAEYKSINYEAMENHEKITTKLMEHGIVLHYDGCIVGNSFTQYRFTPSIGVKMKTIGGYAADIEQAIGMSGVRIVAPIPNTTFVGIEIPNKDRTFADLTNEIIGSKASGLPIGIDQNGDVIRLKLEDMPHMLVAGATGSGKSVFLNATIKAILNQGGVSLKLIDPKMVELAQFADRADEMAYDIKQATIILESLVNEMLRRYSVMKSKKVKSFAGCKLQQIVCVIDEFADLVMAKRPNKDAPDIEALIIRLAQMGRAAGIHLIIATQRPDSKVITGLIKANFPTKVAFATSSEINSRIILDDDGAEKLLGRGDGLIANPRFNGLRRFQGYMT